MRKPKTVVEFQLVVIYPKGTFKVHGKKDKTKALEDAAKYDNDPLGRTAHVEERTVTTTQWVRVSDSRDMKEDDSNGTLA